jgi:hypothetical protein
MIGFSSCADFLEIKDKREIILEDFWSEKADVDNIVAGCYSAFQTDDVRKRMMIWGEFRSDNIMSGENINSDANLFNILKENITAKNDYTTWDGFYNVINRCNTVLKYAPDVAAKDPAFTEGDLRATIAEVTALRSLAYFYLIRTFRDVPFSREAFTDDDQKMDLPATPFKEVLNNLIVDLEEIKDDAVKRYPETKNRYQTGRITQDAIYAMLCELYLWAEDYDNCVKYADYVIKSKQEMEEEYRKSNDRSMNSSNKALLETRLNGIPLVNDNLTGTRYGSAYKTIFCAENREAANREVIFEINYDHNPSSSGLPSNKAVSSFYGNSTSRKGLVTASSYIAGEIKEPTEKTLFEKNKEVLDARIYLNYDAESEAIVKLASSEINIDASNASAPKATQDRYSDGSNSSHWVIYRLPDVMLFKAEALCQMMKDGSDAETTAYNKPLMEEAFRMVNVINKRAICKPNLQDADTLKPADYSSKLQMTELVKRERQREFMFEGKRWYDLVRYAMRAGNTSEVIAAVGKRDDVNSQFAQNFFKKMDAIFWPYNYEEMKVNHNLNANPAFGSGESNSYEKTN